MRRALAGCFCALAACASAEGVAPPDALVPGRIDASLVDAAPAPDAGMIVSGCMSAAACTSATSLGMVSGDTGSDMLSADGYQAAWYRVRVTEDYSDSPGLALRVSAALTQPAGKNFDVFVYVNASTDTIECSTTTGTTTTSGNTKEVRAEWGEGFIPNGAEDGRDVSIEIRPATGTTCASGDTWHLDVAGNWL